MDVSEDSKDSIADDIHGGPCISSWVNEVRSCWGGVVPEAQSIDARAELDPAAPRAEGVVAAVVPSDTPLTPLTPLPLGDARVLADPTLGADRGRSGAVVARADGIRPNRFNPTAMR